MAGNRGMQATITTSAKSTQIGREAESARVLQTILSPLRRIGDPTWEAIDLYNIGILLRIGRKTESARVLQPVAVPSG
jgi:hypothetical protein